jgi:hypothetical protein
MKSFCPTRNAASVDRLRTLAFTLTEVMVSMAVMLMMLGGILSTHLFGLRMYDLTRAKLGASDDARNTISRIVLDIRAAKVVRIGSGSLSSFTECAMDTPQKGNAIQLYPTAQTNQFIRYYMDASDSTLKRTTNGATVATVIAHSISNLTVFTSEDHAGNVVTNNEISRVIGLTMHFVQLYNPSLPIGPGNHFDFYQLSTRITPRAP